MVILGAPPLRPVRICRTVEHERIHRSCYLVLGPIRDFLEPILRRSVDPGVHVLEWYIGILR